MSYKKIIESGLRAAQDNMCGQDKIWSRYSHDKVDVGEVLAKVIRTLSSVFPLNLKLRALSIGSSDEPQFRILETAFRGGLYLLDINNCALNVVKERIKRQRTDHVITIEGDYNKIFLNAKSREDFFKEKLNSSEVHLVTLHHSLYYCLARDWLNIFDNLYSKFLAHKAAMHAVLMSSKSTSQSSTTWLYNHFAGKFFGVHDDQDLRAFKKKLQKQPAFKKAQVELRTNRIYFDVDDFKKFMAVVWMILLYPNVHKYSLKQREEITEFIYKKFYKTRHPLIQEQDHLVVYKGIKSKGLI
ncbi:MAG: class I SAM-dependent methyltransferase [Candidatus Omnitrophica bacterium]|nr:class I SAM-dependent methyltransferase [Candidatus Omnitrophota bacterium]